MDQADSGSFIRVDSLRPIHLMLLKGIGQDYRYAQFQSLLLQGALAVVESRLPKFLPMRSPRCLLAVQKSLLLGMVQARPFNRRGSCWLLKPPETLAPSTNLSRAQIQLPLLQHAFKLSWEQSCGWILRCSHSDHDLIALAREVGFQPLMAYQLWRPPAFRPLSPEIVEIPDNMHWQPLNKVSAIALWRLTQTAGSSHLRQILDRQICDLVDLKGSCSGMLVSQRESSEVAVPLVGVLHRSEGDPLPILDLLRDQAWDSRLARGIPTVLNNLRQQLPSLRLSIAADDKPLTELLIEQGWLHDSEEMLLGRNLWRRQVSTRIQVGALPLETMLGRLQPQHPPLPTPSLEEC